MLRSGGTRQKRRANNAVFRRHSTQAAGQGCCTQEHSTEAAGIMSISCRMAMNCVISLSSS
eukprot:1334229-Prymnesium_polylepis.1